MARWVAGEGMVMAAAAVMAMAAAAAVVAAAAAAAVAVAARATAAVVAAAGVGLAATAVEAVAGVGLAAATEAAAAAAAGVGLVAAAAVKEQASHMVLPRSRRCKADKRLRLGRFQSDNSPYTRPHTFPSDTHLESTDFHRHGDRLGSSSRLRIAPLGPGWSGMPKCT